MSAGDKLDARRVVVELELQNAVKRYEGMAICYSVTKTGNGQMNEAAIKIANLVKEDRDYILTAVSPLKRHRERKQVRLYAGYQSTGVGRLFVGDITGATITQPPDIWLCLKGQDRLFSALQHRGRLRRGNGDAFKPGKARARRFGPASHFQAG